MSDPLSIAAGVVGLLTAAAQVTLILNDIISKAKHAPAEVKRVKSEVEDIRNVLQQLSLYTNGAKQAHRSRSALIMVDQVAATLASCITTFDELKLFVEGLQRDNNMNILDRLRWTTKSNELKQLLARLEMHKSSLTLMLTILTCQKQDDAEDKVNHLTSMVQLILQQNVIIAQRLIAFDMSQVGMTQSQSQIAMNLPGAIYQEGAEDPLKASFRRANTVDSTGGEPDTVRRGVKGFAFEELLMNSRAYRTAARHNTDAFSISSAAGRTGTWSMLSGISLSEMSNIAILAIPIYEADLHDKAIYSFEPQRSDETQQSPQVQAVSPSKASPNRPKLTTWWRSFKKQPQKSQGDVEDNNATVFGKPLTESIRYANVAISLQNEAGEMFIYGYIPITVAKVCVFLKEKGLFEEDVFARNGNPIRVKRLQTAFDTPDRYGKGIDFTGYTVYDAATVFLRYLKTLPEPVVPHAQYDAFVRPMREYQKLETQELLSQESIEAQKVLVPQYQALITELPPLNRQLLLYLLDILAVFASRSEKNKMTAQRLVVCFQPSLVAAESEKMDEIEHKLAADVATFLVEYQDDFLIGMSGPGNGQDDGTATHESANTMQRSSSRGSSKA